MFVTHLLIAFRKFGEHVGENLLLLFVVVFDFLLANCDLVEGSLIFRFNFTNCVEVVQCPFEIAQGQLGLATSVQSLDALLVDVQRFVALWKT